MHQHPDDPLQEWEPRKGSDIGAAFDKLKNSLYPHYRGKQYSKREGRLWFRGKPFLTLGEIHSEIDRFLEDTEKQFPNTIKPE